MLTVGAMFTFTVIDSTRFGATTPAALPIKLTQQKIVHSLCLPLLGANIPTETLSQPKCTNRAAEQRGQRLVHTQQFAFPQTEREWRGMAQSAEPVTTMWEVQVPEGIAPGQAFQASVGGLLMVRHSSLFFAA